MATVWGKVSGWPARQVAILVRHHSPRLGFSCYFKLGFQGYFWTYCAYWICQLRGWVDHRLGRVLDDCSEVDVKKHEFFSSGISGMRQGCK